MPDENEKRSIREGRNPNERDRAAEENRHGAPLLSTGSPPVERFHDEVGRNGGRRTQQQCPEHTHRPLPSRSHARRGSS